MYRLEVVFRSMKFSPQTLLYRISIGMYNSPKYDVNPQPNTRGIRPLVGRTSGYRRSVMHVLAVMLSKTSHLFVISQYIFIRASLPDREMCPLSMCPGISRKF